MTKIMVLEDSSKVDFGGGQKITLEVCAHLASKSHQISIVDLGYNTKFFKQAQKQFSIISLFKRKQPLVGFESSTSLFQSLIQSMILPNLIWRYFKHAYRDRPDIVYTTTRLTLIIGIFLTTLQNRKHVHHFHSQETRLIYIHVLRVLFLFVDQVIVPSNYVKQTLKSRKVTLVPNFVDDRFIKNSQSFVSIRNQREKVFRIAFIGSFMPYKGALEFKEVREYFLLKCHEAEFLILGSDPLKLAGEIPVKWSDNVIQELQDIDCALFLSQSPESFGIAALEAALSKKLVLYNSLGALPEVLDGFDNCISSPNFTPDTVYNLISKYEDISDRINISLDMAMTYSTKNFHCAIDAVFTEDKLC